MSSDKRKQITKKAEEEIQVPPPSFAFARLFDGFKGLSEDFARMQKEAVTAREATRDACLSERIEALPASERPLPSEVEDIRRRLVATERLSFALAFEALESGKGFPGRRLVEQEAVAFWESAKDENGQEIPAEKRTSETLGKLPMSAFSLISLNRVAFAFAWPDAWHGWRNDNAARLGVRLALAGIDDPEAERPEAQDRLHGETARALARAQKEITWERWWATIWPIGQRDEREGMLAIDADAADWLEGLDPKAAAGFRRMRKERLRAWKNAPGRHDPELGLGDSAAPPPPWETWLDWVPFARLLAEVLWAKKIKPALKREQAKHPALVRAVHVPVMATFSAAAKPEEANGQRVMVFEGQTVLRPHSGAFADASVAQALAAEKGLHRLRSIAAHRLLRWLVFEGHRKALSFDSDPRLLRIEGGYRELARRLGMRSNKAAEELGQIIEALNAYELPIPFTKGGQARFLSREIIPHAPGQRAVLNLILGTALLPDYVEQLQKGRGIEARMARRLIPMVDFPPMKGLARERDHGALASLSMGVMLHLRDNARELVTRGGALLDSGTWLRLGQGAGVPKATIGRVIEGWVRDGDDAPAFLKLVDRERYTLGDAHRAAREFLEQGGQMEIDGQMGGEKAKESKAAKLQRIGRGRRKR